MNKLFATLAVLTTTFSFAAHANYVGTQNDNTNIEVGESTVNGGPHVAGRSWYWHRSNGLYSTESRFSGIISLCSTN